MCGNKNPYSSEVVAGNALRALTWVDEEFEKCHAYLCPYCWFYHIGHKEEYRGQHQAIQFKPVAAFRPYRSDRSCDCGTEHSRACTRLSAQRRQRWIDRRMYSLV